MINILEELTVFTPLGIRFWDAALDRQIREGLVVRAWPESPGQPVVEAFRTASDVYAFRRLPGLLPIEYPESGAGTVVSPPEDRSYVIQVEDTQGRYVAAAFAVSLPLPYSGVFLRPAAGSPPVGLPGFLLYPAATRPLLSSMAVVRGDLVRWDPAEPGRLDRPAAHAVVEVHGPSGEFAVGVADTRGRFAVVLPYPEPEEATGSPPTGGRALFDQSWTLTLSVRYAPAALVALPGTEIPDYGSVLDQGLAEVWESLGSPPEAGTSSSEMNVELNYGRDLVVRTQGSSSLLVTPTA